MLASMPLAAPEKPLLCNFAKNASARLSRLCSCRSDTEDGAQLDGGPGRTEVFP